METPNLLHTFPDEIQKAMDVLGVESIEKEGEEEIYTDKGGTSYSFLEGFLMGGIFKFCLCGNSEEIIHTVGKFLISYQIYHQKVLDSIRGGESTKHEEEHREYDDWFNTNKDLHLYLLYFLDSIEMMEHGGCVTSAWITDKGKAYIEIYNYYKQQEETKGENNNE